LEIKQEILYLHAEIWSRKRNWSRIFSLLLLWMNLFLLKVAASIKATLLDQSPRKRTQDVPG
jgi:hypothetical protein